MASNNIARLGVVLGIDTAVFSADIDKAISENRRFGAEMKRGSQAAMQEALNLKYATEDYGKEISRLAQVERQLATGRMSMAHDTVKQALRDQAKAYDDAVAAAKRLQQAQAIDKDVLSLKRATDDYGKTLSQVQAIEREIAEGKYRTATDDQKNKLLQQAKAYDDVVAAAKRLQQAQAVDKEVLALKHATDDYGKSLTKVQIIEREIASGSYRTATDDQKNRLRQQAIAYDDVVTAAKKLQQAQSVDKEVLALKNATDDYGKSLTKVQVIEREIASGSYRTTTADQQKRLLDQARAYDQVVAAAQRAQQAQAIDKDIQALKFATEDYGKSLSKVQIIEREIASGSYRTTTADQQKRLLDQAKAYDQVTAAAQRAQQAQGIDKEIQALKYATEDYGKTLTKVQIIEREIANGRYRTATDDQKKRLLDQARAFDAVAASQQNVIATQGQLTTQQRMSLTYQTTDVVTSLVSGQNPFMVLIQQGGQLKDTFGGIGPMFRTLAMAITPVAAAVGGVAAVLGVLGFAASRGSAEQAKFNNQLALTGDFAKTTYNDFLKLSSSLSDRLNISVGETKDIFNALIGTGKITGPALDSIAQAIGNVSRLSGENAKEVADKMIPSLMGGASAIKNLNDRMNFLTVDQYKLIVNLEKQGKLQDAAKIAADALNAKLKDQETNLGYLQKGWKELGIAASAAWNFMMGLGREDKGMDRAKELEKKINQMTSYIEVNKDRLSGTQLKARQADIDRMRAELNQIAGDVTKKQDETRGQETQKAAIEDEARFGSQRRAMDDAVAKQRLENFKTQQNLMADAEMQARNESDAKISAALIERNRKNREEAGVFAAQNEAEYQQTLIASRLGFAQKLTEIQQKRDLMGLDLRKQQIEEEFRVRFNEETEIGKVESERDKKIALTRLATQKKNIEERGLYEEENRKALLREEYTIMVEADDKIEAIRLQRFTNLQNALAEWRQENNDQTTKDSEAQMQAAQALASEIDKKFLAVEQDRASLQLQMELVGLSEKERNIALNRLQTEQEIAAIRRNDLLTPEQKNAEIQRINRLGLQRENLISMQDDLRKVGEVNSAIFGNMEKAIENFVRTGKFSFKDFARSVIQDLIMIQLKAAATSILRTIIGAATGNPMMMLPSATGQFGVGPTGYANGGQPQANRAALVGERGPELFVPKTAGTIVPNSALSDLGGTQVINNYNIQAIDVKSFEDRIMGSSNAVWAANAYANKSLAIGRGRV